MPTKRTGSKRAGGRLAPVVTQRKVARRRFGKRPPFAAVQPLGLDEQVPGLSGPPGRRLRALERRVRERRRILAQDSKLMGRAWRRAWKEAGLDPRAEEAAQAEAGVKLWAARFRPRSRAASTPRLPMLSSTSASLEWRTVTIKECVQEVIVEQIENPPWSGVEATHTPGFTCSIESGEVDHPKVTLAGLIEPSAEPRFETLELVHMARFRVTDQLTVRHFGIRTKIVEGEYILQGDFGTVGLVVYQHPHFVAYRRPIGSGAVIDLGLPHAFEDLKESKRGESSDGPYHPLAGTWTHPPEALPPLDQTLTDGDVIELRLTMTIELAATSNCGVSIALEDYCAMPHFHYEAIEEVWERVEDFGRNLFE